MSRFIGPASLLGDSISPSEMDGQDAGTILIGDGGASLTTLPVGADDLTLVSDSGASEGQAYKPLPVAGGGTESTTQAEAQVALNVPDAESAISAPFTALAADSSGSVIEFVNTSGSSKTPDQITGLQLWLDMNDLNAANAQGAAIETLVDKSGKGNDFTQATVSLRGLLKKKVKNGHSTLRFDGVDDFYDSGTKAPWKFLNDGSDWTVITVLAASAAGITGFFFDSGGSDIAKTGFRMIITGDESSLRVNNGSASVLTPSTNVFVTEEFAVVVFRNDVDVGGPDVTVFLDGTQVSSDEKLTAYNNANPTDNMIMGRNVAGAVFFSGDIAEIIMYDSVLSTADRESIESYLASKFNITGPTITTGEFVLSAARRVNFIEVSVIDDATSFQGIDGGLSGGRAFVRTDSGVGNGEFADFEFTEAGVVTLLHSSLNVVANADTDGFLTLEANAGGNGVKIRNRLGFTIRLQVSSERI